MADITSHPFIRSFKKRLHFGRPDTILVLLCKETGKEIHIVKNWTGSAPPGAAQCSHCGKFHELGGNN